PSSSETLILVFAEISSSETCRCSRCWRSFVPKLVSITATSINRSDRSDRSGRSDRSVASVVRSFKIFRNVQGPQNGERSERLERSERFERNLTPVGSDAAPPPARQLRRGEGQACDVEREQQDASRPSRRNSPDPCDQGRVAPKRKVRRRTRSRADTRNDWLWLRPARGH